MKKILALIVCIGLIVCLCACSDNITHGEVYKKEYREKHSQIMTFPLVISTGKTMTTVIVPYWVHYPDRYVIFIKDFNGEEWVTEDFYVSKEVYDSIEVGDMFEFDENRGDLDDEPYSKEKADENGT